MRAQLKRFVPRGFFRLLALAQDKADLARTPTVPCDTTDLARLSQFNLDEMWSSTVVEQEWSDVERDIARFSLPEKADGVNLGDQRAIYYLLRQLRPKAVLEVGTHIGASTVHIVAAQQTLRAMFSDRAFTLVTVDIDAVNDVDSTPWLRYGATYSPADMVNRQGAQDCVTFTTQDSISFLTECDQKYDFIFLDGTHRASVVYQEIAAALKLLHKNGVILLHDYFPRLMPLWRNGVVIPGPFLATRRLQREGAALDVLPLGALPWRTKLDSTVTSLALLGKV